MFDNYCANTRVANTRVANTRVANTLVANTRVANTRVANTRVANTWVANTQVANTRVANTQVNSLLTTAACMPTLATVVANDGMTDSLRFFEVTKLNSHEQQKILGVTENFIFCLKMVIQLDLSLTSLKIVTVMVVMVSFS